ncbi:helix-turn-helix transcriptional regulator [Arenibacter palladensis]|uniref:helix-turn-helix domain-containing protein n=1 Tax=Arenibacter palladensis TaxID=237373 RepID=UPI002FD2BC73
MNKHIELNNINDVAAFIKDSRVALNISQETLSVLSGVERSWISRLEMGRIDGMSLKTLEKLIKGLNSKLIIVPSAVLMDL